MLASLSLVVVVSLLVAISVLPGWSVAVAVAILAADVAWLRQAAVSERRGRARAQTPGSDREQTYPPPARPEFFEPGSVFDSYAEKEPEAATESQPVPEIPEPVNAAQEAAEEAAEEADPRGWAPVPVPPPTYTLKAKAADPVTVPTAISEHLDSEPWSLEGLVYDCDLDELVERRSAAGA